MLVRLLTSVAFLSTLNIRQGAFADDHHYGSEENGYVDHHYGDGGSPSHDPYYGSDPSSEQDQDSMREYNEYNDHHYYSNYGAGDPSDYSTHGSLVLDDVDSFNEFVDMDMLETAILAVFPAVDGFGEEYDLEQDAQFKVYSELAGVYSHLFRFGHTRSPEVAAGLVQLRGGSKESSPVDKGVTLLVAPAPLLAKNHPLAGSWLRFPGSALTREALQTFVFMESAPLVGQFDWRASERASAVNLPLLVVFAEVEEELHHTYHNGAEEEGEEQQQKGGSRADGGGGNGFAGAGRSRPMGVWTFDSLSDVLRPVGLEWRHDVNVLVGDKRAHSYEMHNYGLALPENDRRTVGLGIKHDERHYKKVVLLPGDETNGEVLASEAQRFIEQYFAGSLKAEPSSDS